MEPSSKLMANRATVSAVSTRMPFPLTISEPKCSANELGTVSTVVTLAVTPKFWDQLSRGIDKVPVVLTSEETKSLSSSVVLLALKFSIKPNQKSFPLVGMAGFWAYISTVPSIQKSAANKNRRMVKRQVGLCRCRAKVAIIKVEQRGIHCSDYNLRIGIVE